MFQIQRFFIVVLFFIFAFSNSGLATNKHVCSRLLSLPDKKVIVPISIPEVLNLSHGEHIPIEIINKYSPTDIARNLVRRLDRNNQSIISKKNDGFNPLKETDVVMFFRAEDFQNILKKGFLNYHQIGNTRGDSSFTIRANKEDEFLGLNIENGGYGSFVREKLMELVELGRMDQKAKVLRQANLMSPYNRIRAKYAYLFVTNKDIDIGNTVFRNQYGHYGAVFKNEVKSRSTWTPSDSLGVSGHHVYTFQDHFVQIKAFQDMFAKYYFEIQIWGDLRISDVAYWVVPEGANEETQIYKLMKATGIPIKQYIMEETIRINGNKTIYPKIF